MQPTLEEKVAQTLLQQDTQIQVGDHTYTIAPPSVATLILASEAISHLPAHQLNPDRAVEETLHVAKDCRALGEVVATLILGAKQVNELVEIRHTTRQRRLWGLFHTTKTSVTMESRKEHLSRELLENVSPRQLHNIIAQVLSQMQVADFFGITTFLTEINLLRPTKVETAPTASGQ